METLGILVPCMKTFYELFFVVHTSDDEDDEEMTNAIKIHAERTLNKIENKRRNPSPRRVKLFVEETIFQSSAREFQSHFRLKRRTFELLLQRLMPHLENEHGSGRPTISPNKQLLAVLWLLATPDSYRY